MYVNIQSIHKRMVRFTMYLVWKPHHSFVHILYTRRILQKFHIKTSTPQEDKQACLHRGATRQAIKTSHRSEIQLYVCLLKYCQPQRIYMALIYAINR
jgi:hypothetical protein